MFTPNTTQSSKHSLKSFYQTCCEKNFKTLKHVLSVILKYTYSLHSYTVKNSFFLESNKNSEVRAVLMKKKIKNLCKIFAVHLLYLVS